MSLLQWMKPLKAPTPTVDIASTLTSVNNIFTNTYYMGDNPNLDQCNFAMASALKVIRLIAFCELLTDDFSQAFGVRRAGVLTTKTTLNDQWVGSWLVSKPCAILC